MNLAILEGEMSNIKFEDLTSDKPVCRFELLSYHASKPAMVEGKIKVKYYSCPIAVTFYGKPVFKIKKKFVNGDNVFVQGKLRIHESGRCKLIGVHIDFTSIEISAEDNEIEHKTNIEDGVFNDE